MPLRYVLTARWSLW